MRQDYYYYNNSSSYLAHYGVLGMKWGVRRYQNADGSLTAKGRKRYGTEENFERSQNRKAKIKKVAKTAAKIGLGVAATGVLGAAGAHAIVKNRKAIYALLGGSSTGRKIATTSVMAAKKVTSALKKSGIDTNLIEKTLKNAGATAMSEASKYASNFSKDIQNRVSNASRNAGSFGTGNWKYAKDAAYYFMNPNKQAKRTTMPGGSEPNRVSTR